MSREATNWAWTKIAGGSGAKAVLLALARRHTYERGLFPSIAELARMVEMEERSVRRNLRRLEDAGLIRTRPRNNEKGRQTSHEYELIGLPGQIVPPTANQPGQIVPPARTECPPPPDKLSPSEADRMSPLDIRNEKGSDTRVGGQFDRPPSSASSRGYLPIEITEELKERLLTLIDYEEFDAYIVEAGTRVELNGSALRVVVKSQYVADWIRARFEDAFREVFARDAVTYKVESA